MIFWKKDTWKKLKKGDRFEHFKGEFVERIDHQTGTFKLTNGDIYKFDGVHTFVKQNVNGGYMSSTQWKYAFVNGAIYDIGERVELKKGEWVCVTYYDDHDYLVYVSFIVKDFFKSDSIVVDIDGKDEILTVGYGHLITLYNEDLPSYSCTSLEVGVDGIIRRIRDSYKN